MPSVSRRTMAGAVRTASRTSSAPPSATSTAISAPELPAPTTSTLRFDHAVGRDDIPGSGGALDPFDLDARPNLERGHLGVPLEVLDHPVTRRPLAERTGHPVPRQAGKPTHGVQMQPVVPRSPRSGDVAT